MTEQEAETKICPFNMTSMVIVQVAVDTKEDVDKAKSISYCATCQCMMWTGTDCGIKSNNSTS